ncbi:hypothetical protein Leryth_025405, partial [Lithospermum erythrorhizon]
MKYQKIWRHFVPPQSRNQAARPEKGHRGQEAVHVVCCGQRLNVNLKPGKKANPTSKVHHEDFQKGIVSYFSLFRVLSFMLLYIMTNILFNNIYEYRVNLEKELDISGFWKSTLFMFLAECHMVECM